MKKYMIIFFFLLQFLYAGSYGGLLLHGNCTTCHYINTHKSAPSLKYIKEVYKNAFPDKKTFVEDRKSVV